MQFDALCQKVTEYKDDTSKETVKKRNDIELFNSLIFSESIDLEFLKKLEVTPTQILDLIDDAEEFYDLELHSRELVDCAFEDIRNFVSSTHRVRRLF